MRDYAQFIAKFMHLSSIAQSGSIRCAVALFALFYAATASASSLSDIDRQLAVDLAKAVSWVEPRTGQSGAHPLSVQTLSIEKHVRKKNKQERLARVYQFHYNLQQSRLVLINLDSNEVEKTQLINTVHLPLNATEMATARTLVETSPDIMFRIRNEHDRRSATPLADLATLDIKASIFEPGDQSHVCATQRCALISLFDQTHTVFSVEPLVNLQRLTVTTLQANQ